MRTGKKSILHKITEVFVLVSLMFILLIILVQNNSDFFFSVIKEKFILPKISKSYKLTTGKINVDFISGNIVLRNVKLTPVLNSSAGSSDRNRKLLNIELKEAGFYNISWFELFFSNRIDADAVFLKAGNISYFNIKNKVRGPVHSQRRPVNVSADLLKIVNTEFSYYNGVKPKLQVKIGRCNLKLTNLKINSSLKIDRNENFSFAELQVRLKDIFLFLQKKRYFIRISDIDISDINKKALIKDLTYSPHNPGNLKSTLLFRSKELTVIEPRFITVDMKTGFISKKIILKEPHFSVFHKRERKKKKKIQRFPHELTEMIPFPVNTGPVIIKNGLVRYSEQNFNESRSETIYLSDINGNFTGINRPEIHKIPGYKKLNISGKFMGRSEMVLKLTIPDPEKGDNYYLYGNISKINLPVLNRFLRRNTKLRIDRGILFRLVLNLWLNNDYAEGDLIVKYKNLKVSLLKKKDFKKKRGLVSFLANTLIRNRNLPGTRRYRTAKIYYPKPNNISFTNFIWRALLSGIKYCVGL